MAVINASRPASEILYFASCLEQAWFPRILIPSDDLSLQAAALELLEHHFLIIRHDVTDTFTIPPQIRQFIRQYLQVNSLVSTYMRHALQMLSHVFPSRPESSETLMLCEFSLPHALIVWESYVENHIHQMFPSRDEHDLEKLCLGICRYLCTVGKYTDAQTFAYKALQWRHQLYHPASPLP